MYKSLATKNDFLSAGFLDFPLIDVPARQDWASRLGGQRARNVLLVFQRKPDDEVLVGFLEKVLAAVKLDVQKDVCLLPITYSEQFCFVHLRQSADFQYFIAFGIAPERMGLTLQASLYQPFMIEGTHFLFADDLQQIYEERQAGGKQMSSKLWQALKNLFL